MASITRRQVGLPDKVENLKTTFTIVVALAIALLSWQMIVWISEGWVPSLSKIGSALITDVTSLEVWQGALITFRRLLIGFVGSTIIGICLGFLMGLLKSFDAFWRPLIVVGLAIPDPVYFLVAILILGTEESTALFALILAVAPFVTTIVVGAVD